MQVWKYMIIKDVAHKFQTIKKLAEKQKEHFQEEIEVVRKELEEMKRKSIIFEKELNFLKAKEQKSG